MNGKQATRIRDVAHRLSSGRRSGTVSTYGNDAKGLPFETVRNTGYRATYQNLKRMFLAVPRPEREVWLAGATGFTFEEVADPIAAASKTSKAAHEVSKLAFPE